MAQCEVLRAARPQAKEFACAIKQNERDIRRENSKEHWYAAEQRSHSASRAHFFFFPLYLPCQSCAGKIKKLWGIFHPSARPAFQSNTVLFVLGLELDSWPGKFRAEIKQTFNKNVRFQEKLKIQTHSAHKPPVLIKNAVNLMCNFL